MKTHSPERDWELEQEAKETDEHKNLEWFNWKKIEGLNILRFIYIKSKTIILAEGWHINPVSK